MGFNTYGRAYLQKMISNPDLGISDARHCVPTKDSVQIISVIINFVLSEFCTIKNMFCAIK